MDAMVLQEVMEAESTTSTDLGAQEQISQSARQAMNDVGQAANDAVQGDLGALWKLVESYAAPAVAALLMLVVGYFAAKLLSRMASMPVRRKVDETLGRFTGKLIFYSIMLFTILGVLGMFGVSVTSFAAVIGAAGFAIGLAFQGTLSNFSAGVLLLVFRPFKVGDIITAGGVSAKVDEIDLFVTTLNTSDNRRFIVPNSQITGSTIENVSFHSERRVDLTIGVDYNACLETTRRVLGEAVECQREKMIEGEGRGFQVVLSELGDSAVIWTLRFWTTRDDYWTVREQLLADVKNGLDRAGIGIPFPQMDVHLHQEAA
jgi:small conductance mechanosensitive channel